MFMHEYMFHMHSTQGGLKRSLESLELELQAIVNCHVGPRSWAGAASALNHPPISPVSWFVFLEDHNL